MATVLEEALERRLCRRGKHHRAAIVLNQLRQSLDAWGKKLRRYHLRLVEHDDAVDDVVQLAAARGAVGEERLEQLHVRRDDDGRVPVLRCEPQAGSYAVRREFRGVEVKVRLMLEHVLVAEDIAIYLGVLLDDGRVRLGADHARHAVVASMLQREAHERVRLAAARRRRERVDAGAAPRSAQAVVQDAATPAVEVGLGRVEAREALLKTVAQGREGVTEQRWT